MTGTVKPAGRSLRWKVVVNTLIVMFGALLSRVLGTVRDGAIAYRFGVPNASLDTYYTAFQVPDLLYIVISGGALASTLIPVFQQVWHDEGAERAWEVVSAVVNLVLIALLVAALLVVVLASPLSAFYFASKPVAQQHLLAQMMRLFIISSPFLLGLGGIAMAVLNARERFGWTAAAFNLYNLAIIGGAVFLAQRFGIWGVAWGVVAGAFLYLLIMLPGLMVEHAHYVPRLGLRDPAVRRVGRLLVPRLIGQAAAQVGLLATGVFAARLPNNQFTALRNANQLMQLPHGIFVLSLVTVMFPQLARLWSSREYKDFSSTALRTLRLVIFVSAPAAVVLGVLRVAVIRIVYERGNFTATSTLLVAAPLLLYATALVAFAASEPLIRTFYAMQDTRTPVLIGIGTIVLNIAISYLTVYFTHWGTSGLAFAFSIANNLEAILLFALLAPRLEGIRQSGLARSLLGMAISAATMGLALWGLFVISRRYLPFLNLQSVYGHGADAIRLLVWLAAAGIWALLVYVGMATLMHVPEVGEAWVLVRRRAGRA
ncbi:MAG: murein biosynthesis integral membrane protein MurJ [Herpetosiphonaceae bacterium]|nr:murein biosynthesis integral membrane protein MurJ [Herpetosiphonaceae bacterium]